MMGRIHATSANDRDVGQGGYALVSVLWLLGLLAAALASMSVFTVNSLSVVSTASDRAAAEALVRAAMEASSLDVARLDQALPVRGRTQVSLRTGRARADWIGEAGRIDVNLASPELLAGLFQRFGAGSSEAQSYAALVVRRRQATADRGGAGPFGHLDELARTGLPAALVERVRPFATVYGGAPGIDPRLASREVLAALPGMTQASLRTMLELQAANESVLTKWTSAAGDAGRFLSLDRGGSVRTRIVARLANGYRSEAEVASVAFLDDSEPYRVLSWNEAPPALPAASADDEP